MEYICECCGRKYDERDGCPDSGIEPGTKFEDLPKSFKCPECGGGKEDFSAAAE